jgi:hypothetical protein
MPDNPPTQSSMKLAATILHGRIAAALIDFEHYGDQRVIQVAKLIDLHVDEMLAILKRKENR